MPKLVEDIATGQADSAAKDAEPLLRMTFASDQLLCDIVSAALAN